MFRRRLNKGNPIQIAGIAGMWRTLMEARKVQNQGSREPQSEKNKLRVCGCSPGWNTSIQTSEVHVETSEVILTTTTCAVFAQEYHCEAQLDEKSEARKRRCLHNTSSVSAAVRLLLVVFIVGGVHYVRCGAV